MSLTRLQDRLWNWGQWARHDAEGGSSSIASFWRKWLPHKAWDAGWGDPNGIDGPDSNAVDDLDAEAIDAWVRQMSRPGRATLVRRYVHGHRPQTPHEIGGVRGAVEELAQLMGENVKTARFLRMVVRRRPG